jgi:hypothetical protein
MEAVRRTVTVRAPQRRAFDVFTSGIGSWWPIEGHSLEDGEPVIEPRVGGRFYERTADGRELDWGQVAAWEPPDRVLLLWQLNPEWAFDPDRATAMEVEVRFIAEGPDRTRVELEHRGFEVHGAAAEEFRERFDEARGWSQILAAYEATLGGWS